MGVNARLVGIVIFFAALGGALWWMLGEREADAPSIDSAQSVAKRKAAPEPVIESTAPAPEPDAPVKPRPTAARKASTPEPKEEDKPRTGDGEIVVSVVTEQGQTVAGATILLELVDWDPHEEPGEDLLRFETVSGADGTYTFAELPDGDYAARAWTATAGQSDTAYLGDNQKKASVTLELWDGAPTSGLVVNNSGEPIANAVVHVYETDRFPGQILATTRSTSARAYTNERGEFRFPILWTGDWRLYAKADGYASAITETIKGGDTNVRIVLGKGASVSGKVIDELTKGGLPNIEVKLASDFPRDNFSAKSDIDGAFVITTVREGKYKLTVVDEDLVPTGDAPELQLRDGQDEKGVDVFVTPGAIVTGRV
ncbi:MAG: carboxypeptidase regulatory-like domain-containing protein, partial [Candidatus Hydrogenedentota bacterium]